MLNPMKEREKEETAALSSGEEATPQGKLSSGNFTENGEPETGPRAPELRIAKRLYRRRIARKSLTLIGAAIIVSTVIYLCFAVTIIRLIPTNNAGFIPIRNLTAEGGVAKPGDQIVVNVIEEQGDSIMDRAKQSTFMTSNAAVVEVLAGPFGKISPGAKNTIAVNGKALNAPLVRSIPNEYLDNQYVVKCIKGNCAQGMAFVVSVKNVYGEPLSKYREGK